MLPEPSISRHWDQVYTTRADGSLSWHQDVPALSLRLSAETCPDRAARILDAGAGTSRLVDGLLGLGYTALTLVDISESALAAVRERLGDRSSTIRFISGDLLALDALPAQDLWHDRAVFHFLTTAADRVSYVAQVRRTLVPGGHALLATFAPDGPERCSGLPVCRYDADALAREFGHGFELVRAERESHVTPAGTAQPFTYAILRLR